MNYAILETNKFAWASRHYSNLLILLECLLLFFWVILLFRWRFGWLGVGILFTLSVYRRWAFPFLPFALGLLGRSSALRFLFSLSSCECICLRVSIDSCWARIISNCSLWTRAASQIAWPLLRESLPCKQRLLSLNWNLKTGIRRWQSACGSLNSPD